MKKTFMVLRYSSTLLTLIKSQTLHLLFYYYFEHTSDGNHSRITPVQGHLLKVNNGNTRKMCETGSKLTITNFSKLTACIVV